MSANDGGPAFPQPLYPSTQGNGTTSPSEYGLGGMSLRDWFAGHAMAGMLSATDADGTSDQLAMWAYIYADAMLKARAAK